MAQKIVFSWGLLLLASLWGCTKGTATEDRGNATRFPIGKVPIAKTVKHAIDTISHSTPFLSVLPETTLQESQKRALIIAIGDYKKAETGWPSISSANDIPLIKNALLRQAFPEENIAILQDEAATRPGIVTAIQKLENQAHAGDMIVIHYSGHGQQIYDDNGDELDGLDEALVAFGAPAQCIDNLNCNGEKHVRDDELGTLITRLREKVGINGHVIVSLDACHSGSGTRGGYAKARGGMPPLIPTDYTFPEQTYQQETGFGMHESISLSRGTELALGKFVLFAGASFDERNYETQDENGHPVGSLTYAVSRVFAQAREEDTYRTIFADMMAVMAEKSPYQSPTLEGDVDNLLFGGEVIPQTPYFSITWVINPKEIIIDGGLITGATQGSQVALYKNGTAIPDTSDDLLATGEITQTDNFSATVTLHQPLPDLAKNSRIAWVFVTEPARAHQPLQVSIGGIADPELQKAFTTRVSFLEWVTFTRNPAADLFVKATDNPASGQKTFIIQTSDHTIPCEYPEDCSQKMERYAHGTFIKSLKPYNLRYHITMELIPVKLDEQKKVIATLNMADFLNAGQVPCLPESSYYRIKVKNKGTAKTYYNIIDIQPDGRINPLVPLYSAIGEHANPREFFLEPGEERILPYNVRIEAPYGIETFKVFTDSEPVDLQNLIRGNPRGARVSEETGNGSSFDYVFKIEPSPQ